MAKAMTALYPDENTAQWVTHELKQVGVSRHDVALVLGDEAVAAYAQIVGKPVDSSLRQKGRALVTAWVMDIYEKDARQVFNQHKPAAFNEVRQHRRSDGLLNPKQ